MYSQNRMFHCEKWRSVENDQAYFTCICENGKEVTALQFLKTDQHSLSLESFVVHIQSRDPNCTEIEKEIFEQKFKEPHLRIMSSSTICKIRGLTTADLPKIFNMLKNLSDPLPVELQEKAKAILSGVAPIVKRAPSKAPAKAQLNIPKATPAGRPAL